MLGRFEEAVLVALINAKDEATTADVYEALADKLPRRVSFGAIYTTLDRMLDKKFVEVRKGEPLPERGGKARNYYRVRAAAAPLSSKPNERRVRWRCLRSSATPLPREGDLHVRQEDTQSDG